MKPGLSFPRCVLVMTLTAAVFGSRPVSPETVVPGDALAVRSSGWSEEGAWVLRGNGYAGTYVRKHASGPLTVRGVVASSSDAATLTVAVADTRSTFAVAETPSFRASFDLPTGTHLVRIERADAAVSKDELLRLSEVRIDGGDVVNAIDDALALEAADTYIEHFRQGSISFSMPEGLAGREARVMLRHRGFRFGANLPGVDNVYLHEDAPAGSEADRFQRTFLERFGVTVPSNAGKWQDNEPQPGVVTMDYPEKILDFAHRHGLHTRMHALIWDTDQQPDWVHGLLAQAKAGDQDAKTALRQAISRRID